MEEVGNIIMENSMTSKTSQPHKCFILPSILGALLIVSITIIILVAINFFEKKENIKIYLSEMKTIDNQKNLFMVQVRNLSKISAADSVTVFVFNKASISTSPSYVITSWVAKLSNFTFSTQIQQAKLSLTYSPKSNEFEIKITANEMDSYWICTQEDNLDFLKN